MCILIIVRTSVVERMAVGSQTGGKFSLSWRLCYIDDTHYVSKLGFFTKDCLKAHCARTEVTCDRWYAHYIYILLTILVLRGAAQWNDCRG